MGGLELGVINTGTTVVTFLMVFLIQRSQNKESLAIELKLNEPVAAVRGASTTKPPSGTSGRWVTTELRE